MLRMLAYFMGGIIHVMSQTTIPPTTPPFMGQAACLLTIPTFPLSPTGLSTPFFLQGVDPNQPCTQANQMTSTFVEAIIFDPETYRISVYHPLVVDIGTVPFLPPLVPQLPPQAIVALFFGTNGLSLTLQPLTVLQQANCVNGISQNDIFGQFAYCNADAFYTAVQTAIDMGKTLNPPLPPLEKGIDGFDCPTTRSFFIVDQDPSDNLVVTYLLDPVTKRVFHDTPTNRLQYPNAIILKNGSDNRLLTVLDQTLGCKSYQIPVLNDPSGQYRIASLPTNEIHASQVQMDPVALIPKGDPMTRVMTANGAIPSLVKINAYRKGVHQPMITHIEQASTMYFCIHMIEQLGRLQGNKALFSTQLSPDPAAATTLFGFLANRFFQSFINLRCDAILDIINPVTLVIGGNGIVSDATFTIVDPIQLPMVDPYLIQPEPTTVAPTTVAPTTVAPTTVAPTTIAPTTIAPTTIAPTTVAPTTIAPTTTVAPTTVAPTTVAPTTVAPTTTVAPMSSLSTTSIIYIIIGSIIVIIICWYKIIPSIRSQWNTGSSSRDDTYSKIPIMKDDTEIQVESDRSVTPRGIRLPRILKK
jgi:hypothetical protein